MAAEPRHVLMEEVVRDKKRQKAKRRGTMQDWADLSRTYSKASLKENGSNSDDSSGTDSSSDSDGAVEIAEEDLEMLVADKVATGISTSLSKKRKDSLGAKRPPSPKSPRS